MIDLRGHAAFITGSKRGVGRSIAEAFAKAGADLVIHGLQGGPEADAALTACRKHGVRAEFITADLTEPTETIVPKVSKQVFDLL